MIKSEVFSYFFSILTLPHPHPTTPKNPKRPAIVRTESVIVTCELCRFLICPTQSGPHNLQQLFPFVLVSEQPFFFFFVYPTSWFYATFPIPLSPLLFLLLLVLFKNKRWKALGLILIIIIIKTKSIKVRFESMEVGGRFAGHIPNQINVSSDIMQRGHRSCVGACTIVFQQFFWVFCFVLLLFFCFVLFCFYSGKRKADVRKCIMGRSLLRLENCTLLVYDQNFRFWKRFILKFWNIKWKQRQQNIPLSWKIIYILKKNQNSSTYKQSR